MTVNTGGNTGPLGKDKLDELGLERVYAYVHIDRVDAAGGVDAQSQTDGVAEDVSEATKNKRVQRQERCDAGLGQYVVWVPNNKEAKKALKAVADAVVADENICSAILSFISSDALLELFELLSTSEPEVSSIIEMARRGDLTALAAINVTNPTLLQAISGLTHSDAAALTALHGILRCIVAASVNAKEVLEATTAASRYPEDVLRFTQVRRRGGLRARVLKWVLGDMA
jgi:hypothetical protein